MKIMNGAFLTTRNGIGSREKWRLLCDSDNGVVDALLGWLRICKDGYTMEPVEAFLDYNRV
jgi:hypothetical protein